MHKFIAQIIMVAILASLTLAGCDQDREIVDIPASKLNSYETLCSNHGGIEYVYKSKQSLYLKCNEFTVLLDTPS